jgi:hypothetical protein
MLRNLEITERFRFNPIYEAWFFYVSYELIKRIINVFFVSVPVSHSDIVSQYRVITKSQFIKNRSLMSFSICPFPSANCVLC